MNLTDFINDGTLARICSALADLTGHVPELRNADGSLIRTTADGLVEEIVEAADDADTIPAFRAPIYVQGDAESRLIGAICLRAEDRSKAAPSSERVLVERLVMLLAELTTENCSKQADISGRAADLHALFEVTALFAMTSEREQIHRITLDAAMRVTCADAGTLRVLDSESGTLRLQEHRGLSQHFCELTAIPLRSSPHDQRALSEELCYVSDVSSEAGFAGADRCSREGINSCLIGGLVYQGRRLGTVRLYGDESQAFSWRQRELLRTVLQVAAAANAHARLLEEQSRARQMQRQVKLAVDVQQRMLPTKTPTFPGLDVASRYLPCTELGGDFYDVFDLNGHLGFVIGDVVGKGVPASLLMASVRSALRAYAQTIYDIRRIVTLTNRALARDTEPNEFATLFYGVLDPGTLRLTYVNAGHEYPTLVKVARDGSVTDLPAMDTGGLPIGIDPKTTYEQGIVDLGVDDVMLCYTDGLPDVMNFENRSYGRARIGQSVRDLLRQEPSADANRVLLHALWESRRFAGLQARPDDITLLAIRVGRA